MKIILAVLLVLAAVLFSLHGFTEHVMLAVAFTPAWIATDSTASAQQLTQPYTVGSNPALALGTEPSGMYVQGADATLGIGQFIYAQMSNAAGCSAGNVCEITQTLYTSGLSISLVNSVQQWAGTANSGKTLCVALATLTQNQFGWFQVYGAALVTTSAAAAVGNGAWWNALGVVQPTAVASKQMIGATCVVASSASLGPSTGGATPALTSTQAIYFINAPVAQAAIT